ncbi:HDOD domain-containing protein [Desulfobacterales bacterium HSG17]|nr:HDOD domain-containing protein [Desulfobacterales bacterium HSG17]
MGSRIQFVPVGEYRISSDKNVEIITIVASCVALMLHDPKKYIAGMLHVVLPGQRKSLREESRDAYFADTGVPLLIREMIGHGAKLNNLAASLAGGGTLLKDYTGSDIGEKNVEAVTAILEKQDIPIVKIDVGGQIGRRVRLNVKTGHVAVQSFKKGQLRSNESQFQSSQYQRPQYQKSGDQKISHDILLKKIMPGITRVKPNFTFAGSVLDAVHCEIRKIDWDSLFLLLARNLPLSMHFFRIANSPYYGRPGKISSFENALRILGSSQFRRICVLASVMRQSEVSPGNLEIAKTNLSKHALVSALAARHIAGKSGMTPVFQEDTFTAALFHGIGGLAHTVIKDSDVHTIDYAELGTIILSGIKMPESIISAVALHEYPVLDRQGNPSIASFVHMGCAVSRLLGISSDLEPPVFCLSSEVFKGTGIEYELSRIIPEIFHIIKSYDLWDFFNLD